MAKDLYIEFEDDEGGSLHLTLLSSSEHQDCYKRGAVRGRARAEKKGETYEEEPLRPRTALLTVRGKDNNMSAAELEKLGKACLRYAKDIREKG